MRLMLLWNALFFLTFAVTAHGQKVAIEGYDPVSYQQQGQVLQGRAELYFEWAKVVWRFATAENREEFRKQPERFAPQFGGNCAYAMSEGQMASGEPKHWIVKQGKLFLFHTAELRKRWLQDEATASKRAEKQWTVLKAKG